MGLTTTVVSRRLRLWVIIVVLCLSGWAARRGVLAWVALALRKVPRDKSTLARRHLKSGTSHRNGVAGVLRTALRQGDGDADAVQTVLEHGLEVLEAASASSPRKQRKAVDSMCERVESVLEGLEGMLAQLSTCAASELEGLVQCLCEVSGLRVNEGAAAECVETVGAALEALCRCSDPVVGASALVRSGESEDRMRGLGVLRDLERVVLDEPEEAEVSVVSVVLSMGGDGSRSDGERGMAWMGTFALCLRNCRSGVVLGYLADESKIVTWIALLYAEVFSGDRSGSEGLDVWISCSSFVGMLFDLPTKLDVSARGPVEKACLSLVGLLSQEHCSTMRLDGLMPHLLDRMGSDDLVLASASAGSCCWTVTGAAMLAPAMVTHGVPRAVWTLYQRIVKPGQPASWWKQRADIEHLLHTTQLASTIGGFGQQIAGNLASLPHDDVWDAMLAEAVHLMKVNKEAELSAQATMPFWPLTYAAHLISKVAVDTSRHVKLLATGVAESLLYAAAHDATVVGISVGAAAASAAVNLIGRNEGGLTLSREAADSVLRDFKSYFVPDTRRGRYAASRALTPAKAIVSMVISDTNKSFVIEHSGALDALVRGLLLEEGNPRRTQEGGDELQATCTLALQNLALSDVGKVALRSHAGVMEGLRRVSSAESECGAGMSVEARQYASGALFELDESTRQQRQASGDGGGVAAAVVMEHVMLSYNWDHQSVIKRVNTSLQSRGYAVWIDIEKMQGSTVEVMSAAVEDAAVMCYGISQAYKESANCRLEAQYAYQQQKEMIPLMLEEGYRANG